MQKFNGLLLFTLTVDLNPALDEQLLFRMKREVIFYVPFTQLP